MNNTNGVHQPPIENPRVISITLTGNDTDKASQFEAVVKATAALYHERANEFDLAGYPRDAIEIEDGIEKRNYREGKSFPVEPKVHRDGDTAQVTVADPVEKKVYAYSLREAKIPGVSVHPKVEAEQVRF